MRTHQGQIPLLLFASLVLAAAGLGQSAAALTIDETPVPTAASSPRGMTLGPDGNVWFAESATDKIARITPQKTITEFSGLAASSFPVAVVTGPDGNLWFTEASGASVGRVTTAGAVTELPGPSGQAIVAGPDGALWIGTSSDVVRFTTSGASTPVTGPAPAAACQAVASIPEGKLAYLVFARTLSNEVAYLLPQRTGLAISISADTSGNRVIEPGETFSFSPHWLNVGSTTVLSGTASNFTGPGSGTYNILDGAANYGTVAASTPVDCASATANCYQMSISDPGTRPQQHWDATFVETLSTSEQKRWKIHLGRSFPDVPSSLGTYRFVETIFHNGITAGCGGGNYCPNAPITRQQMAVFLLVSEHGIGYLPPACVTPQFGDVPCSSGFARWVNQLVAESVTAGCGGGNYCPTNPSPAPRCRSSSCGPSRACRTCRLRAFCRPSTTCPARAASPGGSRSWCAAGSPRAAAAETTVPRHPLPEARWPSS